MRSKTLYIAGLLSLLCSACVSSGRTEVAVAPVAADPANMTYFSSWPESGQVTLHQGRYSVTAAPGSAAEFSILLSDWQLFGTADGQAIAAVILVTQAGGSGSFYDLALLRQSADGWRNDAVVYLGDRVDIHDLQLRNGEIIVTLTTQGEQDPMCCPTQRLERRFAVQEGKLVAAGETLLPTPPMLIGPVWQWLETRYNNDSKTVPPHPEDYTLTFADGGRVSARADCNQKGGSYLLNGQSLTLELLQSTMAMCPEDSLENRFMRDLTAAVIWFEKDGDLYIDLKYDTGTMHFTQQK